MSDFTQSARDTKPWRRLSGPVLVALFAALAMGFVAATGQMMAAALLGGALAAILLCVQPTLMLWIGTLMTLVFAGTIKFFVPAMERIWWVAYGLAFLMFVPALMQVLSRKRGEAPPQMTMTTVAMTILAADMLIATLAAGTDPKLIVVGAKSLIMFGGVWAYLAYAKIETDTMWRWLKLLLWIGALQWVLAYYQYVFVRAARQAVGEGVVSAADSVVGTFGGSMEGGGLTAVLAFFLVSGIVLLFAMRSEKVITRGQHVRYSLLMAAPLAVMEVKILFFYLPVALLVLFRKEVRRRPGAFIGWCLVGASALVAMLAVYQTLHWSARGGDWQENVLRSFTYSFEEKTGHDAKETILTRRQSVEFWLDRHGWDNIHQTLIGHGMGASRTTGLEHGDVAKRYGLVYIDRLTLTLLLWDFGVIGLMAVFAILWTAFRRAGRLAARIAEPAWQRALARGLQATLPLYLMSLLYRNDIPYAAPMMFLAMATLGLIAWLDRQNPVPRATAKRPRTAMVPR